MDYSKFNVHYLRRYAKEIGVKSPSSCKKDALIEKIKEIESGKVEPTFSKVGRPIIKNPDFDKIKGNTLTGCGMAKEKLLEHIKIFKEFLEKLESELNNI